MLIRAIAICRALFRIPTIAWHLGRAGVLGHLARIHLLPAWLRYVCRLLDRIMRSRSAQANAGAALCQALVRLGPGFIKFGQALSTRADLIGPQLGESLSQLQDRLPPFAPMQARQQVEDETCAMLNTLFTEFDDVAVAAASIAQVHRAKLRDGREVAVKLLRPNIEKQMQSDTALFFALAQILELLAPRLRRLHLIEAVVQFRRLSEIELDLRLEAAAGGKLAQNLRSDQGIYVPWIDLEHSTQRMLIVEWIDGIRIDDVRALEAAGHNIGQITEYAARSFFNQVFRDGFFHADMHPGNIFVRADGILVPIDFGIMGHLDFADRMFLARLLNAMLERDYDMVAKLHLDAGVLHDDVSLHHFAQSIRAVADPVMDKPLGEVSLGVVLGQILQIANRFEIEVQTQFNLLQKTMMMAEGVARQLNPTADMWQLARPLAENWMESEAGFVRQAETLIGQLLYTLKRLPKLIDTLDRRHEMPPKNNWPGRVAILALLLAILSFFTNIH